LELGYFEKNSPLLSNVVTMFSKKELELVRSLTAKNIELKQIAKDVIIEKLNKQIAAKDVKITT
jgi:hypothetical protein